MRNYNPRSEYLHKLEIRARKSPFIHIINNTQNKEDMKLYYVEEKQYYTDADMYDIQCADGGKMPMLYRTQVGATLKAEQLMNEYTSIYQAHVVFKDEPERPPKNSALWRCRMSAPSYNLRIELAIYAIESKNC